MRGWLGGWSIEVPVVAANDGGPAGCHTTHSRLETAKVATEKKSCRLQDVKLAGFADFVDIRRRIG